MKSARDKKSGIWISALLIALITPCILACDLPVFRYALEQWPAAPHTILILKRGNLSPENEQAVNNLKQANLATVSVVDMAVPQPSIDIPPEQAAKITAEAPRISLQLLHDNGQTLETWNTLLNAGNMALLTNSPGRAEIVRRIIGGDSVVWLFLKGPNDTENETCITTLTGALNKAEAVMRLPPPSGETGYEIPPAAHIPFKLSFSVLALGHKSAEAAMIRSMVKPIMLKGEIPRDTPVAIPIFGRGRALEVLSSRDITVAEIERVCTFIVGSCSCEVKAQNPGVDLFFPVDWKALVKNTATPNPPAPALLVPVVAAPATNQPAPPVAAAPALPPAENSNLLQQRLVILGVLLLVATLLGAWLITGKGRHNK